MGAAWSAGPWLVRAGFSTFYAYETLADIDRALRLDGVHGFEEVASASAAASLFGPNAGGTPGSAAPYIRRSVYRVDPAMNASSSRQASVGVERALTANLAAAVHYIHVRGANLPRTRNVNLLPPVVLTAASADALGIADPTAQQVGRPVYGPGRLDPSFDNIYQIEHTGSSTYDGFAVTLTRRLANELEWSASYTYSRARDDVSDFDEQPQDPAALASEWSWSRYDQRHRLVVSALFDLPIGDEADRTPASKPLTLFERIFSHVEVAPILTIESGRPQNALTGSDDNMSRAFPLTSRPLGFARNGLRTPASASLDLRVLKYFPAGPHGRLDLVVEAFNLLNRANATELDVYYGSGATPRAGFGRPTAGSGARQVQFSVDYEF